MHISPKIHAQYWNKFSTKAKVYSVRYQIYFLLCYVHLRIACYVRLLCLSRSSESFWCVYRERLLNYYCLLYRHGVMWASLCWMPRVFPSLIFSYRCSDRLVFNCSNDPEILIFVSWHYNAHPWFIYISKSSTLTSLLPVNFIFIFSAFLCVLDFSFRLAWCRALLTVGLCCALLDGVLGVLCCVLLDGIIGVLCCALLDAVLGVLCCALLDGFLGVLCCALLDRVHGVLCCALLDAVLGVLCCALLDIVPGVLCFIRCSPCCFVMCFTRCSPWCLVLCFTRCSPLCLVMCFTRWRTWCLVMCFTRWSPWCLVLCFTRWRHWRFVLCFSRCSPWCLYFFPVWCLG